MFLVFVFRRISVNTQFALNRIIQGNSWAALSFMQHRIRKNRREVEEDNLRATILLRVLMLH